MASKAPNRDGKAPPPKSVTKPAAEIATKTAEASADVVAPVAEQIVKTPAAIAQPAIKGMDQMNETVNQAANETADRAQAMFGEVNNRAQQAAEKSAHMIEEFNDFARGNIEALVESSKIAAKGAEEIAKYSADYGRKAIEQGNENARRLASVKSPTELFQLQSEMMKGAVDSMVSEASKFTENYLKLMGDVVQPISNRVSVAAEKAKVVA